MNLTTPPHLHITFMHTFFHRSIVPFATLHKGSACLHPIHEYNLLPSWCLPSPNDQHLQQWQRVLNLKPLFAVTKYYICELFMRNKKTIIRTIVIVEHTDWWNSLTSFKVLICYLCVGITGQFLFWITLRAYLS